MSAPDLHGLVEGDQVNCATVFVVKRIVRDARAARLALDAQLTYVRDELAKLLPAEVYWLYRGGSHVAVHLETGVEHKGDRLILVLDREGAQA